jgi:NAD(P)-dependent dehydrogenase (short-subunit alcohol dehydrogenase family)
MSVFITGANRGIGLALADHYRAANQTVYGAARQMGMIRLDVTDPTAQRRAAVMVTGPLDLLICNAGVYLDRDETLETGYDTQLWADSFATNVAGVFLTVQAHLPQLRAAGGKVAIISSIMGSDARAPGGSYIYRASKAAVLNLGRNLAVDLAQDGIAVGVYHPGWVQTDMGGASAQITVAQSANGLAKQFDLLSLSNTGCFQNYDGTPIPF